ncbi:hypothetical protein EWM64_g6916 [Hericium alpestre]|uniref:ATP synthase mitochondrial F1 complex assembly factor 2 n=1 Tax=Hericium alpestre TaxID=135208 RepID=A0A4Y9ZR84_9AGAM|nr:hypothetical protein EWM64_g6916 [Hericium alpestre]
MQAARLARALRLASPATCRRAVWERPFRFAGGFRQYALATEARPEGAPATDTNRAEATLKRFWKTVSVEPRNDGTQLAITLDGRPLKTPSGNQLLLPNRKVLAATLIAKEWEDQQVVLKAHALPMTSIASRAIDATGDEPMRSEIRRDLLKYLDTDTVCFYADPEDPPPLIRLQGEHWDPLLGWVRETFDVEIQTSDSVLFCRQPEETKRKLEEVLKGFDRWQLAAMERATYTTKSFLIALALVRRQLTAEQAALVAQVEVMSQIERWGEVEDSQCRLLIILLLF